MKVLNWVARIAAGMAIMFVAMAGVARSEDSICQPKTVVQTAFEYDNYLYFNSTQTQQEGQAAADTKNSKDASVAEQGASNSSKVATESTEAAYADPCAPAKPWQLPQPCWLQRHNITMGGWIEQGITFNNLNPADQFNGPIITNDRDHEYQLNQAWLYFDRPTNTNGCGWDIGGHVDVVYGTDWRFGQNFGLENRFDSLDSFYGLILPQFYGEVAVNDLKIKMGHFATNTSLEKVPAVANFFYSHTYLMGGYFDPLLVTGLQADYKLSDNFTAVGGLNRGWMQFEDPSDSWNFLGGIRWIDDDKRQNMSLMVDSGLQDGFMGLHQRDSVIMVYTCDLSKKLQYGAQYTIGQEKNGSVVTPGQNANWYGTEQLLTYKLNAKWAAGLRYEWVRDEEGSRVAGVGNVLLPDRGWDGLPGMAGSYHDLSLGLNYRPNMNWVVRPEVRWDKYDGLPNAGGQLPFGNHTRSDQFIFACDLILTF